MDVDEEVEEYIESIGDWLQVAKDDCNTKLYKETELLYWQLISYYCADETIEECTK